MCNPNSRKLGSLQPLASAKRKRAESPLQSALRAAVNRGGAALQPRLLFLQPNRRRSQPIWRGSSVRASLSQNRPNFAPRPFAVLLLHRPGKAAARGVTAAHRGGKKDRREFPAVCLNEILFYKVMAGPLSCICSCAIERYSPSRCSSSSAIISAKGCRSPFTA